MPTPAERIVLIEALGNFLQSLEGKHIEVIESVSHDLHRGHDRHCATLSAFQFRAESIHWTISGGNFVVYGSAPHQYSISTGQLFEVETHPNCALIKERYESKTERQTTIKVVSQ